MITVSIISHGHGSMVPGLLRSLLSFPEIGRIILTLNFPEEINFDSNDRVLIIRNKSQKGFGENNNAAFQLCSSEFFCVLNPDIVFTQNPFPSLIEALANCQIGLVAPKVVNENGETEDSARRFLTPLSIFSRNLLARSDAYQVGSTSNSFFVEWIAGMFMLYKTAVYRDLHGFDQRYFLYVEDADICTRSWLNGYRVMMVPSVCVIHNARRATLKNWRHLGWHVTGLIKYFFRYHGQLSTLTQYIRAIK
jgi:GT2 family glycosyltransferase